MQPVLSILEVKKVEQALTIEGVSLAELMHRAGHSVAQEVLQSSGEAASVLIFCGNGNNGGDGWVAAELLAKEGCSVEVITPVVPEQISSPLAQMVAKTTIASGISYCVAPEAPLIQEKLATADVVIDAIFGTGFHGEVELPFDIWIEEINKSACTTIAVDVPSGLSGETGEAGDVAVRADTTVTMLALKPGLISNKGRDLAGSIVVAPLAVQTDQLIEDLGCLAEVPQTVEYKSVITPLSSDVDKFSRGTVLVIGGSAQYLGAPLMSAMAAARAGAGYVMVALPESQVAPAKAHLLESPVFGLPESEQGGFSQDAREGLLYLAGRVDAVVLGPGMGVSAGTISVVTALLGCNSKLVLDADALNCLSRMSAGNIEGVPEILRREKPLVLTPHRKELGRLVGRAKEPPASLTEAIELSRRIVWGNGASNFCIVSKGNASACVDINNAYVPQPGPPSLATAGSGDVLAGIIGALLGRAKEEVDLAKLCAYGCSLHAEAAEIAKEKKGLFGMQAHDVIEELGIAQDFIVSMICEG